MNLASYEPTRESAAPSAAWVSPGRARYLMDGGGFPVHDNDGSACMGLGWFCGGPTGAGFSNMAGVVRPEEIDDGMIKHALAISTSSTRKTATDQRYIACPATGRAKGKFADADAVPIGAHVQLNPDWPAPGAPLPSAWPEAVRIIAQALKDYGAYVRDTGGSATIQGENSLGRDYNPWIEAGKLKEDTVTRDPNLEPDFPWGEFRVIAFKQNVDSGTCVGP